MLFLTVFKEVEEKQLADITEDETNLYGETFDPGSPTERSGAFLWVFKTKV